jgi:hypothetical protein
MAPVRTEDRLIGVEFRGKFTADTPASQLLDRRDARAMFAAAKDITELRRRNDEFFVRVRFPILEVRFVRHSASARGR